MKKSLLLAVIIAFLTILFFIGNTLNETTPVIVRLMWLDAQVGLSTWVPPAERHHLSIPYCKDRDTSISDSFVMQKNHK